MAVCSSCAAPLPPSSVNCVYCGARNKVDFVYLGNVAEGGVSQRVSPASGKPMQLVRIETDGETVEVDQCPETGGMWFDHGELEYLLTHQIRTVLHVDQELLAEIKKDRSQLHTRGYLPCPDCGDFMPTKQFRQGSGVVVDWCRLHGLWLDGGELSHLIEWARAGGMVEERNKILRHVENPETSRPAEDVTRDHQEQWVGDTGDYDSVFTLGGERRRDPGVSILDLVMRLFD